MRFFLPLTAITIAIAALTAVFFATPHPPTLSDHTSGDPVLTQQLREAAPTRGHQALAATVITPTTVTHAAVGEVSPGSALTIGPQNEVEFGSITKTFNGFLLADAEARGEVRLSDPVGQHLPELAGRPLGHVTLAELATHRGGVPQKVPILGVLAYAFRGTDPYQPITRQALLTELRDAQPTASRGSFEYSNTGATLLGWALADAADMPDWATYVQQRLLGPLEIQATFAATHREVPTSAVPGFSANGFPVEHWTSAGYQPAGAGTYISPDAVATYAQAILANRIPGPGALEPRIDNGRPASRMGLAWGITDVNGRQITLHNGGTGGFRTMLAIDREAQRAVFVAANTAQDADALAFDLLGVPDRNTPPLWPLVIALAIPLVVILGSWWSALRAKDRPAMASAMASAVCGLAIGWIGPPTPAGGWPWATLVVVTAVVTILAVRRWPELPWQPRWLTWFRRVISRQSRPGVPKSAARRP